MVKGPENIFRDNKLRPLLDAIPCYYLIKEALTIRGLPDIIGLTRGGRFFCLEVKKSKAELSCKRTPLQAYVLKKVRDMGGFAEFVYPENLQQTIKTLIFSSFSEQEANAVWSQLVSCYPELLQLKDSIPEGQ